MVFDELEALVSNVSLVAFVDVAGGWAELGLGVVETSPVSEGRLSEKTKRCGLGVGYEVYQGFLNTAKVNLAG